MTLWKLGRMRIVVLGAAAFVLAGCGNRNSDFLVVASADCQGYLDPCG